jgi:cyclophilin family peptidyl-prolyl cis-trans isomerase
MSRDRRQQRRRQRQRQRRRGTVGYEPVGTVQLPGIMGWFQRNPRLFYVGGIAVMVLSLGAVFFGTQGGRHSASTPDQDSADEEQVEATPTVEASPTVEAEPTEDPIQRVYSAAPSFDIDPSHSFEAVIRTERGVIRLQLLPDEAPGYVNNFVFLARNRFYDGLMFHRVVPGFVAQAGDPTATGFSGAGYDLPEEKNDVPFDAGAISMAKQNPASGLVNGGQFFITLEPQPALAENFTVFGRVVEGMDVLRALSARDPGSDQSPGDRILSIEIIEDGSSDGT